MKVTHACADCLEEAGGRQQKHDISWQVEFCPCCEKRASVTDIRNFGAPKLSPKILPFMETTNVH